jgi:glycosyltransferase involved in cell wall biosynthesis
LRECLESVLAQTMHAFECIVVNDHSTDSTASILLELCSRDTRLRVVQAVRSGLAAALNLGIFHAATDLIVRMDADDVMLPNRLERQLAFMDLHPSVALSCSYAILTDGAGRAIGKSMPVIDIAQGLALRIPKLYLELIHPAVIFRKHVVVGVGGYREDLPYTEDRELWGRIVTSGEQIVVQPEFLLRYRVHGGSLTNKNLWRNDFLCELSHVNILRRLDDLPEITAEELIAEKRQGPLPRRIRENWSRFGRTRYKAATRDYATRRWGSCVANAGLTLLCEPSFLLRRLNKLKPAGNRLKPLTN